MTSSAAVATILAFVLVVATTAGAAEQPAKPKPGVALVKRTDGTYPGNAALAVDGVLGSLPGSLQQVDHNPPPGQSLYSLRNAKLSDFFTDGLALRADYARDGGDYLPSKGVCCDCRASEDVGKLVVASLLANTLLDPELGPYRWIEVKECTLRNQPEEGLPVVDLVLDLGGSVGLESDLWYQVGGSAIVLYPYQLSSMANGRATAAFLLLGAEGCDPIEHQKLRAHLYPPEPCTPSQLGNKEKGG